MSSSRRHNKWIWLAFWRVGVSGWITALFQPRKGVHCFGKQSAHERKCQVRLRVNPNVNGSCNAHWWNVEVENWEWQEDDSRRYDRNHLGYEGCCCETSHAQIAHSCPRNALIPHSRPVERFGVCCRKTARMGRRFWYGKRWSKSVHFCSKIDAQVNVCHVHEQCWRAGSFCGKLRF